MKKTALASGRSGFLDMLKMVCVIMIIITHVSWTDSARSFFAFPYLIEMAVPVFMIISAYLRANKIEKVGIKRFLSARSSLTSLGNLMVAYVIVAVIEIAAALLISRFDLGVDFGYVESPAKLAAWFFTGLSGPGSYYMPVMVQLIVYYPLIWLLVKKGKEAGVFACFLMNLGYELLVYQCAMNPDAYRLLIFRYTFLIALGVYLSMAAGKRKDDVVAAFFLVMGLFFVTFNAYIKPFVLFQSWKSTCMLCVPLAYGAIYYLKKYFGNISYKKVFIIGKASLHIYLTQMIFYGFGAARFIRMLLPSSMSALLVGVAECVVAIGVCVPAGIVFYVVESKLRKKLFGIKRPARVA